ncbi:MAG: uroporphyrinogen decarboxylase [Dongiaceae bacterium]
MAPPKNLVRALRRQPVPHVPIWLMRQAGRYLPEYRALREQAPSFLEMCLTPELATEVTLQPVRRYPLDAAIIFSDILVVPYALGQHVTFVEGQGPLLEPIRRAEQLRELSPARVPQLLAPVAAAIAAVRRALPAKVALIGFAGAPWTVATYMIEGRSGSDFAAVKGWAYRQPDSFDALITLLVEATSAYLLQQIEAGAEVLQIFDSWAGVLSAPALERWGLRPTVEIVRRVRGAHPQVPVIVFPRGIGASYKRYATDCGCDGLGLDTTVPPTWAEAELQPLACLQGNLDPLALLAGGDAMQAETTEILRSLGNGPFIFNLGHGILPQTPPEHVAELCRLVKGWARE